VIRITGATAQSHNKRAQKWLAIAQGFSNGGPRSESGP